MRRARFNLAMLLVIASSFALSGCPFVYDCYVRNYSDQPVELIFHLNKYDGKKYDPAMYINDILPIKRNTGKHLKDPLHLAVLGGDTVSLTIPGNSTAILPHLYPSEFIYLKGQKGYDTVSIWKNKEINNYFTENRYGFPGSYLYYYDYK